MRNFEKVWLFPDNVEIPHNFQAALGGSEILVQTLYRRGIRTIESAQGFLNPDLYQPASPNQLPGLSKAVDRILGAFQKKEAILVWGDFDVDGQTSTTLLVSALSGHGSKVHHYIPNRAQESHGVSADVLEKKISTLSPSILLTCDTGIDAYDAVTLAQSSGIDVIITDHHQLPQNLPPAYAVINPNTLSEDHALFNLPGVGVAYKLIEALYSKLGADPEIFLDLVALGIVSDVANQAGDTRFLLQKGLDLLRKTPRLGLHQLLSTANIRTENINEETIGFVIGPRLNALGRLDDANTCVEFFTTSDPTRAAVLAKQLEDLNVRRQMLTETIFQAAIKMVADHPDYVEDYPVLILEGSSIWHPGVIGIVASRLVDRFNKPTIMLSQEGKISRGSARSIPGVPISALISESSDLLISHGGHPMAAGLSLAHENVTHFRRDLSDNFNRIVGGPLEPSQVKIDAELHFNSISVSFIKDFKRLAPFGAGNPKLLFATRSVNIVPDGVKSIGKDKNHKKVTLSDSSGTHQDLLWWNSSDISLPVGNFDVAYSLDLSTYKNNLQVQATLQHFRNTSGLPILVKTRPKIDLVDLRDHPKPHDVIRSYTSIPGTVIWAELNSPDGLISFPRSELSRADTLVIWTTPPSSSVFKRSVNQVKPKRMVFFAVDPEVQTLRKFITKLLGLIKFTVVSNANQVDFQKAAQSIASTAALIEIGIDWIHAHGEYDLSRFRNDSQITPGPGDPLPGFNELDKKIKFLLKETAAYRSYFEKAKLDTLI